MCTFDPVVVQFWVTDVIQNAKCIIKTGGGIMQARAPSIVRPTFWPNEMEITLHRQKVS